MGSYIKNLNKDERFLIDNIIGNHFIVDYGFITKISSDKKFVDIKHATILTDNDGTAMDITITKNVELLFAASSYFSFKFEVKIGDGVLLLGTKDFLGEIGSLSAPQRANYILHYKQENLKALPLGIVTNPKTSVEVTQNNCTIDSDVNIEAAFNGNKLKTTNTSIEINNANGNNRIAIDNNLLELKTSVSNMKAQLQDIWTAIISLNTNLLAWVSTNASVGSPVTPNPATMALFTADKTLATTKKENVASFLK